jgi:hypothetical protein
MTSSQHRVEFVEGYSDHQVIPDDAATHSTLIQEGETTEHLSFGDVDPTAEDAADAVREPFFVGHANRLSQATESPASACRDGAYGVP